MQVTEYKIGNLISYHNALIKKLLINLNRLSRMAMKNSREAGTGGVAFARMVLILTCVLS